jgi:hypothetical protein
MTAEPRFTCPRCGAVSYHPGDIAAGYCGRCHDWTRDDEYRACHCLCALTHPDDKGICDVFSPVTTRRYHTDLLGVVDVPVCAPCMAAACAADILRAGDGLA